MNTRAEKQKNKVENELIRELKEDAENVDIVSVNTQGLVSMINDHRILMFDNDEYEQKDVIKTIIEKNTSMSSFFILDIGAIFRRYKLWMKHLSRVKIYYAVKCNPDKMLLNTLADLGIGFDVASKVEISIVREFNVDPNRIIFANPVKETSHITFAEAEGIKKMTFDNEDELKKISVYHPNAQLILRILVDDSKSKLPFGSKFGCPKTNLHGVFSLAKTLGLNIIGVSFHVGSGCDDPSTFSNAIIEAKDVFVMSKEYGFHMYMLDIGGGFPGYNSQESDFKFIQISQAINEQLEKSFNDIQDLEVIAEPGRFFATSCGTVVTNVIGRKIINKEDNKLIHYYINSNLYGLFNNIIFDKAIPNIEVLKSVPPDTPLYQSVIFGQTCDSMDKIADGILLPELSCGNWIVIKNHGAYTIAAASNFNGFESAEIKYVFTY